MTPSRCAVIFDWNGTLFDDVEAVWKSFVVVQERYGHKPCSLTDYQNYFDIPLDKHYRNAGFSEKEIKDNLREMQELLHQEYAQREKKAPLRKAAREVLERLDADGTSAVILSNHLLGSIQEQCQRFGISPLIRDFLANRNLEEQMHFPPKGERLRSYMAENKTNAAQTIIVGDTPEEIKIAHQLGIIGVAITDGWASEERLIAECPHFLIHELNELPALARRVLSGGAP